MIFISLLLALTPPQTASTPMSVHAQVSQTCLVTVTRVTCRGALDRPGQVRITRAGRDRNQEAFNARALNRANQARIAYAGYVTVVEF